MLTLDPKKRISAIDALGHEYFWTDPMPCKPEELPKVRASMSIESHQKRMSAQQQHEAAAKTAAEKNKQRAGAPDQQHATGRNPRGPPGGPPSKPGRGQGGPRGPGGHQYPRGHSGSGAPPARDADQDFKRRRMEHGHDPGRGREPVASRRGDNYDASRDGRASSSDRGRGPAPHHASSSSGAHGGHHTSHHSTGERPCKYNCTMLATPYPNGVCVGVCAPLQPDS